MVQGDEIVAISDANGEEKDVVLFMEKEEEPIKVDSAVQESAPPTEKEEEPIKVESAVEESSPPMEVAEEEPVKVDIAVEETSSNTENDTQEEAVVAVVEVEEEASQTTEPEEEISSEEAPVEEEEPEVEEEEEEEEEDLVDPHDTLREACSAKASCVALKEVMDACTARVEGKTKTSETCTEELIDFMHCVDECAATSLFSKLK